MENHDAEIFALDLREWFSTGFLTPVISTALPGLHPCCGITSPLPAGCTSPQWADFSVFGPFWPKIADFNAPCSSCSRLQFAPLLSELFPQHLHVQVSGGFHPVLVNLHRQRTCQPQATG